MQTFYQYGIYNSKVNDKTVQKHFIRKNFYKQKRNPDWEDFFHEINKDYGKFCLL